ncbi:hypothetical protein CSUI_000571 [Cystoisospora suis]|uniref:Uncharacterized protein n=1 Tax=Cystoisospora suis TaxID=483139 RepID=A0A2C6LDF8_9APIC|nr:hypothetical protein CSUI_000571 [Cystoisospora suis]
MEVEENVVSFSDCQPWSSGGAELCSLLLKLDPLEQAKQQMTKMRESVALVEDLLHQLACLQQLLLTELRCKTKDVGAFVTTLTHLGLQLPPSAPVNGVTAATSGASGNTPIGNGARRHRPATPPHMSQLKQRLLADLRHRTEESKEAERKDIQKKAKRGQDFPPESDAGFDTAIRSRSGRQEHSRTTGGGGCNAAETRQGDDGVSSESLSVRREEVLDLHPVLSCATSCGSSLSFPSTSSSFSSAASTSRSSSILSAASQIRNESPFSQDPSSSSAVLPSLAVLPVGPLQCPSSFTTSTAASSVSSVSLQRPRCDEGTSSVASDRSCPSSCADASYGASHPLGSESFCCVPEAESQPPGGGHPLPEIDAGFATRDRTFSTSERQGETGGGKAPSEVPPKPRRKKRLLKPAAVSAEEESCCCSTSRGTSPSSLSRKGEGDSSDFLLSSLSKAEDGKTYHEERRQRPSPHGVSPLLPGHVESALMLSSVSTFRRESSTECPGQTAGSREQSSAQSGSSRRSPTASTLKEEEAPYSTEGRVISSPKPRPVETGKKRPRAQDSARPSVGSSSASSSASKGSREHTYGRADKENCKSKGGVKRFKGLSPQNSPVAGSTPSTGVALTAGDITSQGRMPLSGRGNDSEDSSVREGGEGTTGGSSRVVEKSVSAATPLELGASAASSSQPGELATSSGRGSKQFDCVKSSSESPASSPRAASMRLTAGATTSGGEGSGLKSGTAAVVTQPVSIPKKHSHSRAAGAQPSQQKQSLKGGAVLDGKVAEKVAGGGGDEGSLLRRRREKEKQKRKQGETDGATRVRDKRGGSKGGGSTGETSNVRAESEREETMTSSSDSPSESSSSQEDGSDAGTTQHLRAVTTRVQQQSEPCKRSTVDRPLQKRSGVTPKKVLSSRKEIVGGAGASTPPSLPGPDGRSDVTNLTDGKTAAVHSSNTSRSSSQSRKCGKKSKSVTGPTVVSERNTATTGSSGSSTPQDDIEACALLPALPGASEKNSGSRCAGEGSSSGGGPGMAAGVSACTSLDKQESSGDPMATVRTASKHLGSAKSHQSGKGRGGQAGFGVGSTVQPCKERAPHPQRAQPSANVTEKDPWLLPGFPSRRPSQAGLSPSSHSVKSGERSARAAGLSDESAGSTGKCYGRQKEAGRGQRQDAGSPCGKQKLCTQAGDVGVCPHVSLPENRETDRRQETDSGDEWAKLSRSGEKQRKPGQCGGDRHRSGAYSESRKPENRSLPARQEPGESRGGVFSSCDTDANKPTSRISEKTSESIRSTTAAAKRDPSPRPEMMKTGAGGYVVALPQEAQGAPIKDEMMTAVEEEETEEKDGKKKQKKLEGRRRGQGAEKERDLEEDVGEAKVPEVEECGTLPTQRLSVQCLSSSTSALSAASLSSGTLASGLSLGPSASCPSRNQTPASTPGTSSSGRFQRGLPSLDVGCSSLSSSASKGEGQSEKGEKEKKEQSRASCASGSFSPSSSMAKPESKSKPGMLNAAEREEWKLLDKRSAVRDRVEDSDVPGEKWGPVEVGHHPGTTDTKKPTGEVTRTEGGNSVHVCSGTKASDFSKKVRGESDPVVDAPESSEAARYQEQHGTSRPGPGSLELPKVGSETQRRGDVAGETLIRRGRTEDRPRWMTDSCGRQVGGRSEGGDEGGRLSTVSKTRGQTGEEFPERCEDTRSEDDRRRHRVVSASPLSGARGEDETSEDDGERVEKRRGEQAEGRKAVSPKAKLEQGAEQSGRARQSGSSERGSRPNGKLADEKRTSCQTEGSLRFGADKEKVRDGEREATSSVEGTDFNRGEQCEGARGGRESQERGSTERSRNSPSSVGEPGNQGRGSRMRSLLTRRESDSGLSAVQGKSHDRVALCETRRGPEDASEGRRRENAEGRRGKEQSGEREQQRRSSVESATEEVSKDRRGSINSSKDSDVIHSKQSGDDLPLTRHCGEDAGNTVWCSSPCHAFRPLRGRGASPWWRPHPGKQSPTGGGPSLREDDSVRGRRKASTSSSGSRRSISPSTGGDIRDIHSAKVETAWWVDRAKRENIKNPGVGAAQSFWWPKSFEGEEKASFRRRRSPRSGTDKEYFSGVSRSFRGVEVSRGGHSSLSLTPSPHSLFSSSYAAGSSREPRGMGPGVAAGKGCALPGVHQGRDVAGDESSSRERRKCPREEDTEDGSHAGAGADRGPEILGEGRGWRGGHSGDDKGCVAERDREERQRSIGSCVGLRDGAERLQLEGHREIYENSLSHDENAGDDSGPQVFARSHSQRRRKRFMKDESSDSFSHRHERREHGQRWGRREDCISTEKQGKDRPRAGITPPGEPGWRVHSPGMRGDGISSGTGGKLLTKGRSPSLRGADSPASVSSASSLRGVLPQAAVRDETDSPLGSGRGDHLGKERSWRVMEGRNAPAGPGGRESSPENDRTRRPCPSSKTAGPESANVSTVILAERSPRSQFARTDAAHMGAPDIQAEKDRHVQDDGRRRGDSSQVARGGDERETVQQERGWALPATTASQTQDPTQAAAAAIAAVVAQRAGTKNSGDRGCEASHPRPGGCRQSSLEAAGENARGRYEARLCSVGEARNSQFSLQGTSSDALQKPPVHGSLDFTSRGLVTPPFPVYPTHRLPHHPQPPPPPPQGSTSRSRVSPGAAGMRTGDCKNHYYGGKGVNGVYRESRGGGETDLSQLDNVTGAGGFRRRPGLGGGAGLRVTSGPGSPFPGRGRAGPEEIGERGGGGGGGVRGESKVEIIVRRRVPPQADDEIEEGEATEERAHQEEVRGKGERDERMEISDEEREHPESGRGGEEREARAKTRETQQEEEEREEGEWEREVTGLSDRRPAGTTAVGQRSEEATAQRGGQQGHTGAGSTENGKGQQHANSVSYTWASTVGSSLLQDGTKKTADVLGTKSPGTGTDDKSMMMLGNGRIAEVRNGEGMTVAEGGSAKDGTVRSSAEGSLQVFDQRSEVPTEDGQRFLPSFRDVSGQPHGGHGGEAAGLLESSAGKSMTAEEKEKPQMSEESLREDKAPPGVQERSGTGVAERLRQSEYHTQNDFVVTGRGDDEGERGGGRGPAKQEAEKEEEWMLPHKSAIVVAPTATGGGAGETPIENEVLGEERQVGDDREKSGQHAQVCGRGEQAAGAVTSVKSSRAWWARPSTGGEGCGRGKPLRPLFHRRTESEKQGCPWHDSPSESEVEEKSNEDEEDRGSEQGDEIPNDSGTEGDSIGGKKDPVKAVECSSGEQMLLHIRGVAGVAAPPCGSDIRERRIGEDGKEEPASLSPGGRQLRLVKEEDERKQGFPENDEASGKKLHDHAHEGVTIQRQESGEHRGNFQRAELTGPAGQQASNSAPAGRRQSVSNGMTGPSEAGFSSNPVLTGTQKRGGTEEQSGRTGTQTNGEAKSELLGEVNAGSSQLPLCTASSSSRSGDCVEKNDGQRSGPKSPHLFQAPAENASTPGVMALCTRKGADTSLDSGGKEGSVSRREPPAEEDAKQTRKTLFGSGLLARSGDDGNYAREAKSFQGPTCAEGRDDTTEWSVSTGQIEKNDSSGTSRAVTTGTREQASDVGGEMQNSPRTRGEDGRGTESTGTERQFSLQTEVESVKLSSGSHNSGGASEEKERMTQEGLGRNEQEEASGAQEGKRLPTEPAAAGGEHPGKDGGGCVSVEEREAELQRVCFDLKRELNETLQRDDVAATRQILSEANRLLVHQLPVPIMLRILKPTGLGRSVQAVVRHREPSLASFARQIVSALKARIASQAVQDQG